LATKAATSHTHDDRYYTETEADTLLATKAASSHTHTLTDVTDSGTAAPLNVPATGDAATGEVVKGSDTRLSDARTPSSTLAHKASHETGAGDALSASDIGAAASSHAHDVMASGNSYAVGFVPIGSATHSNTYLRKDGTWGTPVDTDTDTDTTANESITLSGDVSGTGTNAITCTVDDDSHNHAIGTITGVVNTGGAAGAAGKLIKLDSAGHIDSTMINDGDISYTGIADVPSTFAPSSHNHAATDITSGTLDTARLDVGASSGKVAAGNHTHSGYPTIDDSSALTTDVWSASKIISYLVSFYATLANGFSEHKFALEFVWGTDETGLVFTGSGSSEYGILTHDVGSKDIVVSVRSTQDGDSVNNIAYEEDELADVGFDPFWIIANGANTCKIMQVTDANVAGTWAITVIG
jgi:hypothetical protein